MDLGRLTPLVKDLMQPFVTLTRGYFLFELSRKILKLRSNCVGVIQLLEGIAIETYFALLIELQRKIGGCDQSVGVLGVWKVFEISES